MQPEALIDHLDDDPDPNLGGHFEATPADHAQGAPGEGVLPAPVLQVDVPGACSPSKPRAQ